MSTSQNLSHRPVSNISARQDLSHGPVSHISARQDLSHRPVSNMSIAKSHRSLLTNVEQKVLDQRIDDALEDAGGFSRF